MRSKFDGADRSGSGVEMAEPRVTVDRDAVVDSTAEMFTNLSAYLQGELKANNIDYQLLEDMNKAVAAKYEGMAQTTEQLTVFMKDLEEKYKAFEPYLAQIDAVEAGTVELEKVVIQLDEYTRRLEDRFKQLESKHAR